MLQQQEQYPFQTLAPERKFGMPVYLITNHANGKQYVGITAGHVEARMRVHRRRSRQPKTPLQYAIAKYGWEAFSVEVIDLCQNRLELNRKEVELIKFYDCRVPKGYNLTVGGEGSRGLLVSEETRQKLRARRQSQLEDPAVRAAIGRSSSAYWNSLSKEAKFEAGRVRWAKQPPEARAEAARIMAEGRKKKITPERQKEITNKALATRAAQSAERKAEIGAKISASNKGKPGPKHSPEGLARLSALMKARQASKKKKETKCASHPS